MQDRAFDHPAECLQADMRMRADDESLPRGVISGSRVIEKAPGADHAAMAIR
jgi:hypothetical protein